MDTADFQNTFSHNSRTDLDGLVALEPAGPFMRLFLRSETGITFQDHPFRPFVLITTPALLEGLALPIEYRQLTGDDPLCWLAHVETWQQWCRLRDHLRSHAAASDWYALHDSRQQFLAMNPAWFFKGLAFQSVKVLCLTVVTGGSAAKPLEQLTVAVADGQGFEATCSSCNGLPDLLQQLTGIIQDQDPDVLTGYNLTRSTLPLLARCAAQYQTRLSWGRNGSLLHASGQRSNTTFEVYGRSLIELHTLVRHHQRLIEPLGGLSLRQLAGRLAKTAGNVPDTPDSAIQLYQILAPAWHQLAQQLPCTFEAAVNRPAAAALKTLLLRSYLVDNRSLPSPPAHIASAPPEVGQLLIPGRTGPIIRYDLSLLKPAIMQAYQISPAADTSQHLLTLLRTHLARLSETAAATSSVAQLLFQRLLLQAFPELLARHSPLSAPAAAAEIERLAGVIIRDLCACLAEHGADPAALDSQGLYVTFRSPNTAETVTTALHKRLAELLPGVLDCRRHQSYQAMFTYKPGCYALLHDDGSISHQGSMTAARSMEPYLKDFLNEAVALLLTDQAGKIRSLYEQHLLRLRQRDSVYQVMRTEKLVEPLEQYVRAVQNGRRNRAAVYELALQQPDRWQPGDSIGYYVTGSSKLVAVHEQCRLVEDFDPLHPDMNVPWYAERLHLLFKRLEPFLPAEPTLF